MRYRTLGATPLSVSEISVGTGDNAGGMIYSSPRQQRALVERALELGITTFDCSPDYGKGLGEANLGRVLKEIGSPEVVVTTKVEIMPEDVGRIHDKVHESVNDSLLRLGRGRVDVVMLHNPARHQRNPEIRKWSPLTPRDILEEVLPAFEELRNEGKAGYFGLACERCEPTAVREVLATGRFSALNVWYNVTNPSASVAISGLPPEEYYSGLFDAAAEFGVGVAVIRPLAGGALTGSVLEKRHGGRHPFASGALSRIPSMFEPEIERGRKFAFLHRPPDQTISEAAVRFVLEEPRVSTMIGGFSDVAQLEEAVRAAERGPLSADDRAAIEAVYHAGG